MLFCRLSCFFSLILLNVSVLAQSAEPDLYIPEFFSVTPDTDEPDPHIPEARAWLHSDGSSLSLIVEVLDPDIVSFQSPAYSDHVQIWLGLDETAFPSRFPLATHPNYVGGMDVARARGISEEIESIRMFSADPQQMEDWSPFESIPGDSMLIPDHTRIREISVPYGMMHLAFFPDERRVELLDREAYRYLEQQFGRNLGDWLSGIRYDVDTLEHGTGYIISADIPATSFGFSRMPRMDALKVLVGVANAEDAGRPAYIQSYSQPVEYGIGYGDIRTVSFRTPLYLNPSNIPDEIFQELSWFPTLFLSAEGWTVVSADVDAMLPVAGRTEPGWQEILFSETQVEYQDYRQDGLPVRRLSAKFDQLYSGGLQKDYFLIEDKILVVSRLDKQNTSNRLAPHRVFRFSDGATGIFTRESGVLHPYGWGDCGQCLHETMSVFRYADGVLDRVASWEQSEGPDPGFMIDNEFFEGFFLARMDMIKGNEIIVLLLNHQQDRRQKRIKLTWNSSQNQYITTVEP